ncbi:MAG: endonuclease III [Spirochaetaceae bacterium]|nr:endonuclease III [Spirochaetaceae bacterium]
MVSYDTLFTTLKQLLPPPDWPFTTAYQVLVFCIISLRTKDEVSYSRSKALFAIAPTARLMCTLSEAEIAALIYPAGFFKRKAEQILTLSQNLTANGQEQPPANLNELLNIKGVGLKTANLVLSRGFNIPAICVDVHVHRICNRLGLINTTTPDESEAALRLVMPKEWWIDSNQLLVSFGQTICKPQRPLCSKCPFNKFCPKIII